MFDAAFDDALWQPGAGDPTIGFDLDGDVNGLASFALGYDWQNGIGLEGAVLATGWTGFDGPCTGASDEASCSLHADISDGSFRTTALMANLHFAPFEARGSHLIFQPFVVAGLGVADYRAGDWPGGRPRPPAKSRPSRARDREPSREPAVVTSRQTAPTVHSDRSEEACSTSTSPPRTS